MRRHQWPYGHEEWRDKKLKVMNHLKDVWKEELGNELVEVDRTEDNVKQEAYEILQVLLLM